MCNPSVDMVNKFLRKGSFYDLFQIHVLHVYLATSGKQFVFRSDTSLMMRLYFHYVGSVLY